jgi:hypothetical protein
MKGERKRGLESFPSIPTTPFTPSFIRRGNYSTKVIFIPDAK